MYLLSLEGMEGSSHDLGLSVTESTSARYGLSAECKPGRPACILSYRCFNKVGSAFIVSELKLLPHPGHFCFSVAKSCPSLYNPMDWSTPGFPVLHYLPEFAQTHAHWISSSRLIGEMVYSIIVIKRAASGIYQSRSTSDSCVPMAIYFIFPNSSIFTNKTASCIYLIGCCENVSGIIQDAWNCRCSLVIISARWSNVLHCASFTTHSTLWISLSMVVA